MIYWEILAFVGFSAEAEVHDEDVLGSSDDLFDDVAGQDRSVSGGIYVYVDIDISDRRVLGEDDHIIILESDLSDDLTEMLVLSGP